MALPVQPDTTPCHSTSYWSNSTCATPPRPTTSSALRFPEQYRHDPVDGANLFLLVSEWPAERAGLLRLFAQSRAAENQAYLTLCNRIGTGQDGTWFGGASVVFAPDGKILIEAGTGEELVRVTIDPAASVAARFRLNVLGARRPGVDL